MPLLIAAQLLLAVPAVASVQVPAQAQEKSHDQLPCHEMPMSGGDEMPCCPDGAESMKDCLASCTLIAAIAPGISVVPVTAQTSDSFVDSSHTVASLSEPPLKPPPIA